MKLLNFWLEGELRLGVKTAQGIVDVTSAADKLSVEETVPTTMSQVLRGGKEAGVALEHLVNRVRPSGNEFADLLLDESTLELAPCVTEPGKIICVGLNYRRHAAETGMAIPAYPVLFNKFTTSLAAHSETIPIPPETNQVDYEAELAIVIGETTRQVSLEEALEKAAGYCIANDLSARDLQLRTNQWMLGKACDKFAPLGPYLVTADEVGNPNKLKIRTLVNGHTRQDSHTSDMIFSCAEIISYISTYMTLDPGDVILTGTPEGVIMGRAPDRQVYLQPGDQVTIEIEKLGRLINIIGERAVESRV